MQVGDVEQVPVSKRAALAEVEVGGCGGVEPKCIGPVGDGAVGELLPELSGQGSAGRCRWGVADGSADAPWSPLQTDWERQTWRCRD